MTYYESLISSVSEYEFAGVFADRGISGTTDNRPEFQRMLQLAREGNIDLIITKSISRFARNTAVVLQTVRELKDKSQEIKKKVCAYARVSTEHEKQGESLEDQLIYYERLIKANPEYELQIKVSVEPLKIGRSLESSQKDYVGSWCTILAYGNVTKELTGIINHVTSFLYWKSLLS